MWRRLIFLAGLIAALSGCGADSTPSDSERVVVATTTQVADLTRSVVGDRASVAAILTAADDPHEFEPSAGDLDAVSRAMAIVASGQGLDSWIERIQSSAGSDAPLLVASENVTPLSDGEIDPHVWLDPRNAMRMVVTIRDGLVAADPDGAAIYTRNAAKTIDSLRALDAQLAGALQRVPRQQRKIAAEHEGLDYLADRFGIRIVGTAIPATAEGAEPSSRDLRDLVESIEREKVAVIFPNAGSDPRIVTAVASEAGIRVGDPLYIDALGPEGSGADTYAGMMRANVRALVAGMRG